MMLVVFVYSIAKNLVPKENIQEFNDKFSAKNIYPDICINIPNFFITPSRHACINMLNEFLYLRENRQKLECHESGLGGIVIEGEPGIGKTEMVEQILLNQGYQEASIEQNKSNLDKIFYKMPVSMSIDMKTRLILNAFDEGAVVIIDEINSSPMLERLLNPLLMGKTPNGDTPKNQDL